MKRAILLSLSCCLSAHIVWGQTEFPSIVQTDLLQTSEAIHHAGAPIRNWSLFANSSPYASIEWSPKNESAEWMGAMSLLDSGSKKSLSQLHRFLSLYPTSLRRSDSHLQSATIELNRHAYKNALEHLEKVNEWRLTSEERTEWIVKMAYTLAHLPEKDFSSAEQLFRLAAQEPNRWGRISQLYIASLHLFRGETDQAAQGYRNLIRVPDLSLEAKIGLIGVEYTRKNYDQVISDYKSLLRLYSEVENHYGLISWVARAYYQQNRTKEALDLLHKIPKTGLSSSDHLVIGMAHVDQQEFEQALPHLKQAAQTDGEIAAAAHLYIGRAKQRLGILSEAITAYETAAEPSPYPYIREMAMYEMALLLKTSQQGHFGQEIKITEQFIDEFPYSPYRNIMSQLLEEFYLSNTDSEVALQAINRLQQPTDGILSIKKFLLNQKAEALIEQGALPEAALLVQEALNIRLNETQNDADSYLLRSEINLREKRYTSAIEDLKRYLTMGEATNRPLALYRLGYAYLSEKQYSSAEKTFAELLQKQSDKLPENLQADSWARLGDSYYMGYYLDKAEDAYRKAYQKSPENNVYALYKLSDIKGLKKQYNEQISLLKNLIEYHRSNPYVAPSMYDLGRAYIFSKKESEASEVFNRLIQQDGSSYYGRNAYLQSALLAYNKGEEDQAIERYRTLIQIAPQTEEAEIAYNSIRSIYMEDGRGEQFLELSRSLGESYTLNSNETKQVLYKSVEYAYTSQKSNAVELMDRFIEAYPLSKEIFKVKLYKADWLWHHDQREESYTLYSDLFKHLKSLAKEEELLVCERLSLLSRERKDYRTSLSVYKTWAGITSAQDKKTLYYTEAATDALQLKDWQEVIRLTEEAITWNLQNESSKRKLQLLQAKALLETAQKAQALKLLSDIFRADLTSPEGAEAVVLWAEQKLSDNSERKTVMEKLNQLVEADTQSSYWLARGIIVLSDGYLLSGDEITAQQYLRSLQKNYPNDQDDIQERIRIRLR